MLSQQQLLVATDDDAGRIKLVPGAPAGRRVVCASAKTGGSSESPCVDPEFESSPAF
jgi:hypothetical protein